MTNYTDWLMNSRPPGWLVNLWGWIVSQWTALSPKGQLVAAAVISVAAAIIGLTLNHWFDTQEGVFRSRMLQLFFIIIVAVLFFLFLKYSYATEWGWVATGLSMRG